VTRVVVVGGGNAGLCAAIAAREAGADVCLLERAPEALRGGNSAFTAGLMRTVYDDVGDLLRLVDSLTHEDLARTDFGSYTADDFLDTLARITEYRCDPKLASQLVRGSTETLKWMTSHGVRFAPAYGRQAFRQPTGSGSGAGRSSRSSAAAGARPTASRVLAGTWTTSFITPAGGKVPVVDPLDAVPFAGTSLTGPRRLNSCPDAK
jgi:succinate dehydrogenase/fumarate reductase flavoprotein subunit